jgi:hypothetical protein
MAAVRIFRSTSEERYPQSYGSEAGVPAAGSATFPARASRRREVDWVQLLAAGTIVAGGALMVAGSRKAGLAVAVGGTALALLEEQDTVAAWWRSLPEYLHRAQDFLDQVEGYMVEASAQGRRLQGIFRS